MFIHNLILFVTYLLLINGFTFNNKINIIKNNNIVNYKLNKCKTTLSLFFDYEEFDQEKKTFTIFANNNIKTIELIQLLKNHRVNFVCFDKQYFSYDELSEMCFKHSISIEKSLSIFDDTIVLCEDKSVISEFELYEIIMLEY